MKSKTWIAGFAFVAMTLGSSAATANSLVFQGVTFETIATSSNTLTLNILDALTGGTGNWADITAMKAFEIKDIGHVTGAAVTSTNTSAVGNWNNSGGGVSASALGCSGGGGSKDCFFATTPVAVTDNMTWGITYNTAQDFTEPHLKVQFMLDASSTTKQGSLLSMAIPVPEPEIYAMMFVGMGLLGFVARRRKSGLSA